MTKEEVERLSGRELDAAVSTALGFVRLPADPWNPEKIWERKTDRWESPSGARYRPEPHPEQSGEAYPPLPYWSWSIAAAWPLMEDDSLADKDGYRVFYWTIAQNPYGYVVNVIYWPARLDRKRRVCELRDPSAAVAICRAFLLCHQFKESNRAL